jgi:ferric-dicitrate binding protein FerR (iron transport regulator)
MMPNPDRVAALIVKGYTGPLAVAEEKELADWAGQSEENRLLLERLNNRQELTANLQEYYSVMREAGQWKDGPATHTRSVYQSLKRAAALALGIAILVAGAWYMRKGATSPEVLVRSVVMLSKTTTSQQTDSLYLPDHTQVWLNNSSSLAYPDTFMTARREVVLAAGEVYFEVAKEKKPFMVKVLSQQDTVQVSVLGTHFNIKAGTAGKEVVTTVLQGQVNITKGTGSTLVNTGEQVIADNKGLSAPHKVDTSIAMAWRRADVFECKNVPISQIMNQLKRWYGIEVEYYGSVADHFSGVFEKKNGLSANLRIMEATTRVKFVIAGNKIVVKNTPSGSP